MVRMKEFSASFCFFPTCFFSLGLRWPQLMHFLIVVFSQSQSRTNNQLTDCCSISVLVFYLGYPFTFVVLLVVAVAVVVVVFIITSIIYHYFFLFTNVGFVLA